MGAKFCQRPFLHLISMVAQTVKASAYNVGDPDSLRWVRKIPWRRKWQPTPVLLTGKSHEWRSLVGYSPWGRKESDTTEQLHFHFTSPHTQRIERGIKSRSSLDFPWLTTHLYQITEKDLKFYTHWTPVVDGSSQESLECH